MSCNARAILFSVQRDRMNVFERNLNVSSVPNRLYCQIQDGNTSDRHMQEYLLLISMRLLLLCNYFDWWSEISDIVFNLNL